MPNLWVTADELDTSAGSPFAYEAAKTASFLLWALSGRKYTGLRTVTERYECPCSASSYDRFAVEPYLMDGNVYNGVSGAGGCGCSGTVAGNHVRLRLRGQPVRSIQRVVSGTTTLDPDTYQVVNSSMLQASPGVSLDVCGLEVTYTFGTEPPTAGRRAARFLAEELCKGWAGETCELPERVTAVSRQGVSFSILDDQAFLDDLRTGIYSVDLFLKAVNPDKARKPARVFSPDLPKAIRITSSPNVPLGPFDLGIVPGDPYIWSVDLNTINGDIILDADWDPQGQLTSWNGATLFEFNPTRFTVSGTTLTLNLTGDETGRITGDGAFDLYAVNVNDGFTVIHVLTSTMRVVGQ